MVAVGGLMNSRLWTYPCDSMCAIRCLARDALCAKSEFAKQNWHLRFIFTIVGMMCRPQPRESGSQGCVEPS